MVEIEEFNFEIEHRTGKKHCNVDALSRRPCRQCFLQGKRGLPAELRETRRRGPTVRNVSARSQLSRALSAGGSAGC